MESFSFIKRRCIYISQSVKKFLSDGKDQSGQIVLAIALL